MNVIELLAQRLPDAADQIASRLADRYATKEFSLSVSARSVRRQGFTYHVQCVDAIEGFTCGWGDTLDEALSMMEKELTSHATLKARKLARAKQLVEEANAL